jgi:hypothetical protein
MKLLKINETEILIDADINNKIFINNSNNIYIYNKRRSLFYDNFLYKLYPKLLNKKVSPIFKNIIINSYIKDNYNNNNKQIQIIKKSNFYIK